MILNLKAKHLFYVIYVVKDKSVQQWGNFISRVKTATINKADEDTCPINTNPIEVLDIFSLLTVMPEGKAFILNNEMNELLVPQVTEGVTAEMMAGITADADGNLPENAPWQKVMQGINIIAANNRTERLRFIEIGKDIINKL